MRCRRYFIKSVCTLCIVLFALQSFARTDKYRCTWNEDPATTMIIAWNQISGKNPTLYYDVVDGGRDYSRYAYSQNPDKVIYSKGMNNHFVRLSNLQPNTQYFFIIMDSEGVSRRLSFETAPNHPDERLSIIAGGDSRNHRTARRNANKMVSKLRPHCVLFGGDMTGSDKGPQWKEWFDDWQSTITSDGRMTPIVVTRGNHEYSNRTLIELFDLKHKGAYYAMTFGGNLLRVYTLNTLIATGGSQKDWLYNDLSKNSNEVLWKFAQYHYAIRPHTKRKSERNDQLLNWATLFYKFGVQLVIESDIHVVKSTYPIRPSNKKGSDEGFIRDDERGTTYIGEGCWGAPLRRADDPKSWTRAHGSFNQFKLIFVDRNNLEIRTVKTDNVDMVGEVDPYNVFALPTGIDLWKPPSGEVIHISHDGRSSQQYDDVAMFTANSKPVEILNLSADISTNEVKINWLAKNELRKRVNYHLQRSLDGQTFTTIAEIKGQGKSSDSNYQINDKISSAVKPESLSYRLKMIETNGQIRFFNANKKGANTRIWSSYENLNPNKAGVLKLMYKLTNEGNIDIRLLNIKEEVVSKSYYGNQKSGNYLKSINMNQMPNGHYLLIIKSNEKVIGKYYVRKGA